MSATEQGLHLARIIDRHPPKALEDDQTKAQARRLFARMLERRLATKPGEALRRGRRRNAELEARE